MNILGVRKSNVSFGTIVETTATTLFNCFINILMTRFEYFDVWMTNC